MTTNAQAPKILAYLRVTNEANKRHQQLLEKLAAEKVAAQNKAAEAVKACVDHERIFGHQKDAVLEKLATSHPACLEFIRDLAAHRNAGELEAIGTLVGQEKKASANVSTGAAVANFDETEAGRLFRERLTGGR
jgi:hypothetical protein